MTRRTGTEITITITRTHEYARKVGGEHAEIDRLKSLWLDQTPLSESDKVKYGIPAAEAFIIGCSGDLEPGRMTVRFSVVTTDVGPLDIS